MGKKISSEKQYQMMLGAPISKLIIKMSIPAVISMMVTVIYNTADTYFVTQINKSASAAVGAIYPIMAIIQAIGYGYGMGCSSLISRMLGKKEDEKANIYATSAFFASIICGLIITILGLIFLEPFMRLLGCSNTMMPYAKEYAKYILIAAPISCAQFVLSNILRASGQVTLSMWGVGIGGVINIILDPVLIFALNLGTAGAAIATGISQIISFIILVFVFKMKKSIVKIKTKYISRHPSDYFQILSTGLPTIFRQSMGSLSAALLNNQAVIYGDAAVAAITIANKVYVLIRNIVLGVGQGFQPVAGYNYGAGNKKRTWEAFRFTTLVGTIMCIGSSLAIMLTSEPIMRWFTNDVEVINIGVQTLFFVALVMPLMAISTYINQMYQCLGFKWQATLLASCRQGIFFVPAVLFLPIALNCMGVQMAQPAADLLTFIVSIPFLIAFKKKHL